MRSDFVIISFHNQNLGVWVALKKLILALKSHYVKFSYSPIFFYPMTKHSSLCRYILSLQIVPSSDSLWRGYSTLISTAFSLFLVLSLAAATMFLMLSLTVATLAKPSDLWLNPDLTLQPHLPQDQFSLIFIFLFSLFLAMELFIVAIWSSSLFFNFFKFKQLL